MTLPSLSPSKAIFSLVLIAALLAGGLASPRAGLAAGAVARPHGAPVHTFEVIYGADSPDKNPGDGVCASTDDDLCTLRAAIEEANASAGEDRIQFRFCGYASKVLYPNSPLPAITEAATIDGDASGIPNCIQRSITLDGSQAGAEADGLRLQGDGIIVKALNIYSFQGNGISIEGDHNQVNASYLGTDRSGAAGLGNWKNGILIHSGDANQVNASILSGNLLSGVLIEGGTNSLVTANKIGLWSPTDSALPNQVNGVRVFGGSGHTIGGDGGLGNLIAGNGQAGVYLGANASQVAVYNNTIGVDADGSVIISNGTVGIEVRGAYNSIGSDQLGTGNLVSGNRSGILLTGSAAHHNVLYHNRVGLDGTSQDVLGNVNDGIILQNGAAANQLIKNDVGGNGRYGIHIAGAGTPPPCDANYLSDNFVGSIYTERAGLGNGADGIYIKGSSCNHVRNNKSGFNANYGIFLDGAAPITATIEQNTCSYNLSGGIAIGSDGNRVEQNVVGYNGLIGMLISGSHNHIAYTKAVGGMVETQLYGIVVGGNDNTLTGFGKDHDGVSQNSLAGIVLNGNQNRVYNYSILDNFGSGVQVTGYDNIIGSEDKETYIDGNVWGIVLEANAMNTQVINTRIGSDRFGFSPLGNGIAGILIRGRFSIIGGSPARRNVIANTQETGILLTDDAYNNQIIDNRIGNNFGAMPNGLHGIQISGNARDNLIQNNLIASNLGAGVRIEAGTGNRLSANQIYDNQGLGIDLGPSGVTNNDSGDVDSGGNGLQNYPVINLVAVDASSTYVQGMLDGAPNSTYLVETYLNDHCDNSGFGQAQEYLGTQFFTSDANGKINLEATLPITSPLGKYLTFTATDPYSSTSELSRCALGRPAGEGAPFMVNSQADADDTDTSDGVCDSDAAEGEQCSLRAAVQQANISTGDNTILLPPGVYTLTQSGSDNSALNGDLDITDTSGGLTIAGAGADQVILQSGIADRLFDIRSGAVATITGVTMMGGHPASSGGGGVIISSGAALTLDSVNVQKNESGMSGGGIYNMGTLTILNSAVVSNTSGGEGGGLYQWGADASLTLLNATLSDNEAAGNGGGLLNQSGAVYLKNVTVAYNTSSGDGGGLFNAAGSFNLQNSIVAHNIDATHAPYRNGVADCGGEFTSGGYNLIGDRARASDYPTTPDGCTLSDSVGDSIGGGRMGGIYLTYSAGLGALQFNNGSTLSRSPVAQASGLTVDLGSPATPGSGGEACEAFDQRGQPRPLDGGTDGVARCDRGAVEHIPPLLSVNDVIVNEGESANFTVSLSEPALITFTVSYSTTGGNAAAGSDYLFASGVLTFPVGAISQTVSIVTLNDAYNETSELFRLRLFNPQWIFINDGRGSAVIQDNDPAPSIAVESADAEEGATMVFTVTLNSPSGQTVTVDYTISGGSATDDEDFSMRQGTLSFAPGVTQQIVRIATLEDQYEESSETLTLALNNSQNASLGAASATGTIADNDTPAFSIADETRAENGDGATPVVMTFHVTLSKISAQTTSVAYTTVAGSASPESDYLPISGVLTFTAGQWTQTIAVTIVSDGQAEPAESFTLVLSSPTGGAILARSVASGVIEASVGRKLYLPLVTR